MLQEMMHMIEHTFEDTLNLLPFLFLTYLLMEYIEHRMKERTKLAIERSGRFAPLLGGIIGVFPQCGFSAAASGLYAGRVITMGTLLAVFLSTSDEMLPILISEQIGGGTILKLLGLKAGIGIVSGLALDMLTGKQKRQESSRHGEEHIDVKHLCRKENCHCERGIFRSALYHSLQVYLFILLISCILNGVIHYVGEDALAGLILNQPVLGQALAGLVGLIPNCASSVVITQLYLEGIVSLGAMMSGLLAGAGVGLLVLFRVNDNIKENVKITFFLYGIGVAAGIIIDALGFAV
ncbi:MAG: putative manganese transporter [Kineothrix sp.]